MAVIRRPAAKTTGSMTRPSSKAAAEIDASRGRNEGPGTWTPAGGALPAMAGRAGGVAGGSSTS